MTIAIPTNDKKTLSKRTGQADYFAFFKGNNALYKLIEYQPNPQKHEHHNHGKEEHHHSHPEILKLLEKVDVLLVRNIGKYMKIDLETHGIKYLKTKESDIEKAIHQFIISKTN